MSKSNNPEMSDLDTAVAAFWAAWAEREAALAAIDKEIAALQQKRVETETTSTNDIVRRVRLCRRLLILRTTADRGGTAINQQFPDLCGDAQWSPAV